MPIQTPSPPEAAFCYNRWTMNYNIKGTHIDVHGELRSYVERALVHADKFLAGDPSAHTDVELRYESVRDGERYCAEFTLECRGGVHRAVAWGESMHAAIDLATAELVAELRKNKNKRLAGLRRTALRVKEYLRGWRRTP
ncbi:MAG: ribosome-associated translation inhibitor RaiA [Patescibacteria group bacterium]|nr:ribosome-associated translation inhibitor RaiA [Patescibacteria group bacterium]